MEQQPPAIEALSEEIIMLAVSVTTVAYDGMKNMFQVTPDLVIAAGLGNSFDQGIAGSGIPSYRIGQFDGRKPLVFRNRLLRRLVLVCSPVRHPVQPFLQRMVDSFSGLREPPNNGKIGLENTLCGKNVRHPPGRLAVQGEREGPGGRFIETVERVDPSPQLVPQDLHGVCLLMTVDVRTVDQETRRFIDNDEVVVLKQHGQ